VLWASAFVGIRAVIHDFGPGALGLGRLLTGAVVLTIVVAIRRPARPSRHALPFIVASGVLWFALYTVTLNTAERFVDAGTASMLVNVGPILIAILGGLFLSEGFPPRLFAGSAVAFLGAAVIGLATSTSSTSTDPTLGIVLCLLAAAAYAVGVVLQKPAVRDTPALTVTWLACVVGAVVLVPFAPALVEDTRSAAPEAVAWMLFLGAFPTALAFTTWAFALSRTTAGRLGSTTYLVPAIAIVLGWIILGEAPPAVAILGGAIAIGGVVIARSRPSRPAVATTPAPAPR
jgi:drug/metabolite transporter (DMT)-like permease